MKITNKSQLVCGKLYKIHSSSSKDCEGCILRWESDEGFSLYEHSNYSRNDGCSVGGHCGGFEKCSNLWYETVGYDDCEITGHPMVIGEL